MKNTELNVATTQNGFRLGTTVDGALTGLHADVIIVDDPIKPMDVFSDSKRSRVNTWFNRTLVSRLADQRTGVIAVVMQRLHEDDLSGMLLRASKQWAPLILQAIADENEKIPISKYQYYRRQIDDVLQPKRETLDELLDRSEQIGPDTFSAHYQQLPVPTGGTMIRPDWLRYYKSLPQQAFSSPIFQAWDVASKDGELNDWSVCTTWLRYNRVYYLIDLLRERMDYPTLRDCALSHCRTQRASLVLVEDAGLGTALVPELNNEGIVARGVKPQHSKQMRLQLQLGKFRDREVCLPEGGHFVPGLVAELLAFPNGRFDDQVDSISLALSHEPENYDMDKADAGFRRFATNMWLHEQWLARLF